MARVFFRPKAEFDLAEIVAYIASDSPVNAGLFVARIIEKCHRHAEFPLSGAAYPRYGEEIWAFPVDRYLVIYRPLVDGIEIVRVVHTARNLRGL